MIFRIASLCVLAVLIAACSHKPKVPQWTPTQDKAINVTLSEAATSVSHDLNTLASNAQAANPPVVVSEPPNPASYGMNLSASVNWQGPVEQVLKKLTTMTNYRLVVLGNRPNIPVIVNLDVQQQMIGSIIRDIGLQCKKYAQIVIMPASKTVELRYLEKS